MPRNLSLVAVQTTPVAWDPEATFERFAGELRSLRASLPTMRLFVYPELYLAALGPFGSLPPDGYESAAAEPVPGPLTDRLCELARELDVWLVPGSILERAPQGAPYNTTLAISPTGEIAARYRKAFPWRPFERTTPGHEFVVFEIDDVGTVGLMICYDGWFPEVARHLAWMGAEVILQVSATMTSDREQELVLARANAIVNQLFVVNVNMGGAFGPGQSIVADPEGRVVTEAGSGFEHLTMVLDLDQVASIREHGTMGITRNWSEISEGGPRVPLPLYAEERFRPVAPAEPRPS
jgi:formamidase